MLDQAFDALKTYDWGADRAVLKPIEEAVISTRTDEAARKNLEERLAGVLKSNASRDAKDYVCRKLMLVGSAGTVPVLAELLANPDLAHMARFALERNPAPEAGQALREALGKLSGGLKVGVISSLGSRRDAESVAALAALASDGDGAVARAALSALGTIRGEKAAAALADAKSSAGSAQVALVDAKLSCAEGLLAQGSKGAALTIYKSLAGEGQPKHVRLAATRGMLACAGKSE